MIVFGIDICIIIEIVHGFRIGFGREGIVKEHGYQFVDIRV